MADEHTIRFVPARLNAAPVVFRGMTERELMLMVAAGLAMGLVPGILIAVALGKFAMVPTCMVAVAFAAVGFGGRLMRRLRRGRPETWLYRRVQWIAAKRGFNGAALIITTATYRARRDRRGHNGGPS